VLGGNGGVLEAFVSFRSFLFFLLVLLTGGWRHTFHIWVTIRG
jgi:hypothetical protein